MARQAVQQQLDDLVRDGIKGCPRPEGCPQKMICFTAKGQAMLEDIGAVKERLKKISPDDRAQTI